MSIRLLQSIFIAGVVSPVDGSTLTLPAALEADLVNQGKAAWVVAPSPSADVGAVTAARDALKQSITGLLAGTTNITAMQHPIDANEAPYPGMVGPTQLIGSALTGIYPFRFMESFWEAIRRKSCKVCFLGDSVTENISQNWPAAHWTIEFQRELTRAFPDVVFEFVNLSIGGKIALQVLGRTLGDAVPNSTLGSTFTAGAVEDATHYARVATSGSIVPTNPDSWQGSASGVAQYANGDVWMARIAPHNFDMMTLCFGLNEENSASNYWFASAYQAIIDNVRKSSTFNGYTRPSIICATPYNDSVDRPLRNRLAEQLFAIAQSNGCPTIDANRWDGIAVEGKDRYRQRWFGEAMYRYLVNSKNDNTLSTDLATYWDITGTPNTGAGGAATDYISGGGENLKLLRKRLSRDVQINALINSSSSGTYTDGIVSLWYRVDPNNTAIGYEVKYLGTGTLSLIYHDGTDNYTVKTRSVQALTGNLEPFAIVVRAIGAVHEVWTVFDSSPPATGYDPKSMRLQFRVTHTGAESGAPCKSDIFKEGWSGIQLNSAGAAFPAIRSGNYSTTNGMMQFGYPLLVSQLGRVTEWDTNGTTNNHPNYQPNTAIIHHGDDRGGNTINHLVTDAYSLIWAAAIGSVLTQLVGSRRDYTVLASGAVQATAPADTAENILAQVLIPAGTMGKNSRLHIKALISFTGSTNSKAAAIKFGEALISASVVASISTTTAANVAIAHDAEIAARNDYKTQSRFVTSALGSSQVAASQSTVDTLVDNYVYFTGTKASAGESLILERYLVALVGG